MFAVVTGASSGIGFEISRLLARKGYDLIIVARRKNRLDRIKKHFEDKYSVRVIPMESDLSKEENCINLFEKVKGYPINVSSISGFQPDPMMATYGATKSYILNLGLSISYELKKHNKAVFLTTLCPGPVNTEFNKVANTDFDLKYISAKRCAKEAVKGLFQKKPLVIPGKDMRLIRIASKFAPLRLILPIEYRIQINKTKREDVDKKDKIDKNVDNTSENR